MNFCYLFKSEAKTMNKDKNFKNQELDDIIDAEN